MKKGTDLGQLEMVSIESLVKEDHVYRKYHEILDFDKLTENLDKKLTKNLGATGYGINRLFKILLLQVMEDLSDRELEKYIEENTAAKYFCGFGLTERTPAYSLFSKVRKKIGTKHLSSIFKEVREMLKQSGYMSEVFNFVDASHLVSKNNLWKERDKAIQEKYEKLNNEVLPKVAKDQQARIGSKGKNKFWYGYKKHISVDMQSGLINKVAITPANVTDAKGLKQVCPSQGMVFADKGYCTNDAQQIIKQKGCADGTIKKNNMKCKNKDQDKWRTKIRAPYERVFSKTSHRVRYKGIQKNQFYAFMEAMSHNLKRLIVLDAPPLNPIS